MRSSPKLAMWTAESRGRMAKIRKKLKRYPTDLTDEEWSMIAPLLPPPAKKGRPRKTDLREVVNAIRYLVRTDCGWEMLPSDFPPWQTVYWWFRRFVRRLLFNTIHDIALMVDRERAGRGASPSAAMIDSQSVKAPSAKARGFEWAPSRSGLLLRQDPDDLVFRETTGVHRPSPNSTRIWRSFQGSVHVLARVTSRWAARLAGRRVSEISAYSH